MPDDQDQQGGSHEPHEAGRYRFYVHTSVPAWRLVLAAGAPALPGLVEQDWRFTRSRSVEDTNPDVRRECGEQGFSLFKPGGTFADVAADVDATSG